MDMKGGAGRLARRLVAIGAVVVIVAMLAIELTATREALADTRREATALRGWQSAILVQLKQAERLAGGGGVGSRLDPADATEALAELIAERDTAAEVMRLASTAGRAGGDGALLPPGPDRHPNSIGTLRGRESSGIAGQDVSAIENDSKAAWGGWK